MQGSEDLSPLPCAGTAQSLVWHGDRLIAGTKRGYFSASLRANGGTVKICDLGADTPLLGVGTDGPPAVAKHVPQSADVALLVDDLAVIVDPTGAPSVRACSEFSAPTLSIPHRCRALVRRWEARASGLFTSCARTSPCDTVQGAPVSFKAKPRLLLHSPPFVCAWVEEQTTLQVRTPTAPSFPSSHPLFQPSYSCTCAITILATRSLKCHPAVC